MRSKLAIIVGLTLASSAAMAGNTYGTDQATFADLDANSNGKLSQSEVASAGITLSKADTNGDGALSKIEYKAALSAAGNEKGDKEGMQY